MVELTQQQVIAYNKKIEAAKEKAANDKARRELAERELAHVCTELSEMLGREITSENLEAEYAAFVAEAQKTMESGTKILEGLEREASEAVFTADTTTQKNTKANTLIAEEDKNPALSVKKADEGLNLDDLLGLD